MVRGRKAALVTGGAKRLGREMALFLASMGYDIALHFNSSSKEAAKTSSQIEKKGVRCSLFRGDLSRNKDILGLIEKVKNAFPDLCVLVNSASIFERASIADTNIDNYLRHLDINLKAPFFLSKEFARAVSKGLIINMLDTRIVSNRSTYAAYSISKKALAELTKMQAIEFAPKIRVNGIAPGLILPPEDKGNDYLERLASRIPLKRKGNTDNIKGAVRFLVENDYVTGQIIFCDGGEHLL